MWSLLVSIKKHIHCPCFTYSGDCMHQGAKNLQSLFFFFFKFTIPLKRIRNQSQCFYGNVGTKSSSSFSCTFSPEWLQQAWSGLSCREWQWSDSHPSHRPHRSSPPAPPQTGHGAAVCLQWSSWSSAQQEAQLSEGRRNRSWSGSHFLYLRNVTLTKHQMYGYEWANVNTAPSTARICWCHTKAKSLHIANIL